MRNEINLQRSGSGLVLAIAVVTALALAGCHQDPSKSYVETSIDDTPAQASIELAISEVDSALARLFRTIDDRNVENFVLGVQHAARARLLLEQILKEDTDNFSLEALPADTMKALLILIANKASKLSSREAADLWLHDPSGPYYSEATGELTQLDVITLEFKALYLSDR